MNLLNPVEGKVQLYELGEMGNVFDVPNPVVVEFKRVKFGASFEPLNLGDQILA